MLIDFHFDIGNGVLFSVVQGEKTVRCFVEQNNLFLSQKGSNEFSFSNVFERYKLLVETAALINIERNGISSDPWGNLITLADFEEAQKTKAQ